MNTQRRIFRGRGGPTDGRLPKHNARRRRRTHATKPTENKYGDTSTPAVVVQQENLEDGEYSPMEIVAEAAPPTPGATLIPTTTPPAEEPWREEIKHLEKRMRNVQESIQTGTQGISNPNIYQENVLQAVSNCIDEWRAILTYYPAEIVPEPVPLGGETNSQPDAENEQDEELDSSLVDDDEEEVEEQITITPCSVSGLNPLATSIDPLVTKKTSLQVYLLLQLSVQCGPLAGSNPGYFKRCGSAVAKMVLDYLNQVLPTPQDAADLHFTSKQVEAIESWRKNAAKAALHDKEPSKSALKKQSGKSKKKTMKRLL